eukprot:3220913-Pleurochrysis_carterae.AAC.2
MYLASCPAKFRLSWLRGVCVRLSPSRSACAATRAFTKPSSLGRDSTARARYTDVSLRRRRRQKRGMGDEARHCAPSRRALELRRSRLNTRTCRWPASRRRVERPHILLKGHPT